jgi:MFS transporter, PHS family, inorganic phosphate transporter
LFSTNVILPSLAFVYWNNDALADHETAINAITLTGSFVGQLIFGFLTDRFGRKRLYGVELLVVIFGTIGFVQCSAGYNNESMSILGLIMFWRFFVGLGKSKTKDRNLRLVHSTNCY